MDFDIRSECPGPSRDSGVVDPWGQAEALQGFPCIFANVVISSLHFLSARVSVIMLKSCKLWDILCVDVGFFFSFFD